MHLCITKQEIPDLNQALISHRLPAWWKTKQKINILMKQTIVTLASFFLMITAFAETPNEKVLKLFNATFNSPQEVKWYDNQDHFGVSFVQDGVITRVKYDKQGNFISSVRYYGKQYLPVNIFCMVTKEFAGKEVYGVTEVANSYEVKYMITLQDDKNLVTAMVNGSGQITQVRKYKKA